MIKSSKEAIDLIVTEEISSKDYYNKKLKYPEWPGGSSGITIGIGYDVGYSSVKQLMTDWTGIIPADKLQLLSHYCGVTGTSARDSLWKVKSIEIPYDKAYEVFLKDLERYEAHVTKLPNSQSLSPDSFGALTSLVYNRGASFSNTGDRYKEMRAIKEAMSSKQFYKIPEQIRSMKRLWEGKGLPGLLKRRDREADLFAKGLKPVISTGATGVVVGTAATAAAMPDYWPYIAAAGIVAFIGYIWYTRRK